MNNVTNQYVTMVNYAVGVFAKGVFDSLSIHKTLKFLVNSTAIAQDVAQCILANGVLLLGSIFLFHKAVMPLTSFLREEIAESEISDSETLSSIADVSVWSFYHVLWILPIWLLCYACSYGWYQSIALNSYQMQRGTPKDIGVQKTVTTGVYATVVWALAFIQIIVFDKVLPLIISSTVQVVLILLKSVDTPLGIDFFTSIIGTSVVFPLNLLGLASQVFGICLMGVMYGWYGFDMIWASDGLDPSKRYSILERHWLYFLGFGMPYVVLVKFTSFFVGYGVYLLLFPFTILISAVSSYKEAHEEALIYFNDPALVASSARKGEVQSPVGPLRMFRLARYVADMGIKYVDSKLRPKRGHRGVSNRKKSE